MGDHSGNRLTKGLAALEGYQRGGVASRVWIAAEGGAPRLLDGQLFQQKHQLRLSARKRRRFAFRGTFRRKEVSGGRNESE